jgi:RNA ligase (TIGR02306 family)
MSNFKVIKTKIEIFDHPNADSLNLGKVGSYQVVVRKGLYTGGEEVVFAPEKSLLTDALLREYKEYLGGPNGDRVSSIRLRGELSCGIIIPPELVLEQTGKTIEELPYNENLQDVLGITKYIPKIPKIMEGLAQVTEHTLKSTDLEVEQFGIYSSEFISGERVIGTEKIHGSQVTAYAYLIGGTIAHKWVTTKNYNHQGMDMIESKDNFYWKCINDINVFENIEKHFSHIEDGVIQIYAEAIPVQKGFSYNLTADTPTAKIIDIRHDTISIEKDLIPKDFLDSWAPTAYDGPFEDLETLKKCAKGMEQVSGKQTNIREGIVLRPYLDRRSKDGTRLYTKIINPKYKETGEEIN